MLPDITPYGIAFLAVLVGLIAVAAIEELWPKK